jgi:DNA repair photolyase
LVKSDMRGNETDAGCANAVCHDACLANVLILFYLRAMTRTDRYVAPDLRHGRGAQSRDCGRFERLRQIDESDGWDFPEEAPALRTQVSEERPRSLINYVSSPDLSFDRTINPYRGCEHGCIYCFARPSHAWLGLSPGLDFETKLIARPDAAEVLDRELRAHRYRVAPIAVGTNTDPYQPVERDRRIMRDCLAVLQAFQHPVMIATKGTLIERDIDILSGLAAQNLVHVGITITTLDAGLNRRMEPRVPSPKRRLATIRRLTEAGIPVRVMLSPIVPGLTDAEIEPILTAARDAGATAATWAMLRLPLEVAPLWEAWMDEHYPDRKSRVMSKLREMHGGKVYDAQFFKRVRGEGAYAALIAQRFTKARKRLALDGDLPALDCTAFQPPARAGDQLSLF